MKNVRTYIPSLILSILLVFLLSGSAAVMTASINLNAAQFKNIAADENIGEKIYSALDRNYREKANATGIPAKIYTDHLTVDYLEAVMNEYIDAGFKTLSTGGKFSPEIPKNPSLEESIDNFFNEYADKTGYKKDENFEKKLVSTKEDAYKTIGSCCDAFKFSAISSQGIMGKLSRIYSHRILFIGVFAASVAAAVLLLLLVNRKCKKAMLYWCGVSALISGIIGAAPSIWLIAEKYFDSFTIKQPQVFAAYTRTFYRLTEAFMAAHIAFAAIGISMIVVYCVLCGVSRNAVNTPADIEAPKDESTPL